MITEENKVVLKGTLQNIQYSHTVGEVEYDKAQIVTKRDNDKSDVVNIIFKKYSNTYKENDYVELVGNLRSFSKKLDNGKNAVSLYVFTYFDKPDENEITDVNQVKLSGRICKIDNLSTTKTGKYNIHFILANNICANNKNLNSYIPSVAWGNLAQKMSEYNVNTCINVIGQLHSREYTKVNENGENETRMAHELVITNLV